jgi:pimeloyl-ACP methyl ester carboxylesterase
MTPAPLKRHMVRVNGVDLFVRDTASDLPPMLCLHGRWGRGETWTDLIARYRDRYRIIAPDQRGHGLSGRPVTRYAGEDQAEDAHLLLRHLGAAPAVVVGHSMGARVAAFLAALHPEEVRAAALLDCQADGPERPSAVPPEQLSRTDALTAGWPTPHPSYEEALRDLAGRFPRPTNVRYFLESLVETVAGYDFMFSRWAMAACEEYLQGWLHLLPQIRCPVLLVRATESWALSREAAERMRPLIRDCTYVEVSNSDHLVYTDNPGEFYPAFDAWLARL